MERKFTFSPDEFYHVYNRGVEKRTIFCDERDRQRFLRLLYLLNTEESIDFYWQTKGLSSREVFEIKKGNEIVEIGAYCLMPNHFHLLLKEKKEKGISVFMLKLLTAYSMYFNKKYKHSGSLFQGPFKANHLDEDGYLKYMYSYIHLNPIKLINSEWKEKGIGDIKRAKDFLSKYKYSSYLDHLGNNRPENKIINLTNYPEYFSESKDFSEYIEDWLSFNELLGLQEG
jgi:putative transposase